MYLYYLDIVVFVCYNLLINNFKGSVKVNVVLIAHTPNPEKTVAASAKLCYSATNATNLLDGLSDEKASSFVEMLSEIGHESPIEHVSFTFAIDGVSRSLSHQLVRHRIASYSQQSQRYVNLEKTFEYVIPPEIANNEKAKDLYIKAMDDDYKTYKDLTEILEKEHYQSFLKEGYSEKDALKYASKKAIEDARYVLPNACETKIVATFNARSLNNFFKHRCCNRAQWEIRDLAILMLKEVRKVAPNLFKNSGPSCLVGPCSEGKMTCRKMKEVREEFKNY